MKFKVLETPANIGALKSDCLIVPVYSDKALGNAGKKLDKALGNQLSAIIKSGDFSGAAGKLMLLPMPQSSSCKRVFLVGLGKHDKQELVSFRKVANKLFQALREQTFKTALWLLDDQTTASLPLATLVQEASCIGQAADYQYTATLSKKAKPKAFATLTFLCAKTARCAAAARTGQAIGDGMNTAKELGNLPGNICTPRYLATEAQKLGRANALLKTTILDEKKLSALGMGSLLSVARGSKEPARLISMEYQGGRKDDQPIVLVGKGITFDTGGISLKPGAAMDEMKFDMCGAASVFGAMQAVCTIKPKLNIIGLVAAAENMPGSQATKPGDVVTSMSGQTIEVLNTDAEGRLVLCDALSYAARFKPKAVVDIATLTGACIIALGHHASGLFSNDDQLANQLLAAGEASGDRAWRLPIWEEYQQQLKSNFADLANIGGRPAGSITAACFLSKFAEDYPWAHIDIAGTGWLSGGKKGATGKPVPLLMNYLLEQS